jgi:pyruvate/2-oxoglutarate dehydrogenase complex dihydrolipoamide dehydrogenase (E3) component
MIMQDLTPDICIIGAGSGGLSVAAAAAAFGVSVVLIEKHRMGGDCLNVGCVPSKALLAAGKRAQSIRTAAKFGIGAGEPEIDFAGVHRHVHGVIAAIAPNDSVERFTALGVKVIQAGGQFIDKDTVVAGEYRIRARRFVVATGSRAFVPPIPGIETVTALTNETIFDLTERPEHLIIIGAGPIGLEMAQAHRRLGCQVTVLEAGRPLPKDDVECAAIVIAALEREGVSLLSGVKVTRIEKTEAGIRAFIDRGEGEMPIDGTHLLVAAGRRPVVDGLGLEAAGIAVGKGGIEVGADLRTTNRRVYAIGDVAGSLQFTHMANYHAGIVMRAILFRLPAKADTRYVPWVTYTDPELAHVGMGEVAARQAGDVRILRWPFHENDRAQAEHETNGMVKLVTNTRGRILGATVVGPRAGELIALFTLALQKGLGVKDLAGMVFAYPTLSEAARRAAITYYTPTLTKPLVRKAIAFLRRFG